jgi:hypothetical protein|tara:strand:- start:647 stop:1579 length:933 start_codon:yes stop_codon:yes gene_type:complete
MNVVFFSESGLVGKAPRNHPNARNDIAWSIMMNADWCPYDNTPTDYYDLGVVTIPKTRPDINVEELKKHCDKITIMQEGPHWYFQDYSVEQQFQFVQTLREADWVWCHNESDIGYYEGLGCQDVRVMRTLMIPEGLPAKGYSTDKSGIILGGNFTSWYSGLDSYLIAQAVEDKITNVSMGRKQPQEDLIDDITYLPYMSWRQWIDECSKYKVGVHMMRTHAAGTFSMNLSYHSTPCLGYSGLDTQDLLHPQTTVEVGDIKGASIILKRLYESDNFYQECSEQTKELFDKYYTEEAWLEDFKKVNKEFNNG